MNVFHMKTQLVSAERSATGDAFLSYLSIHRLPYVKDLINATPDGMVILNDHRQIIYANKALCDMLGLTHADMYVGQRPGELMHCIHSDDGPDGCGTSEACRICGGLNAVLESRTTNHTATREMTLTVTQSGQMHAFDFKVTAAPFAVDRSHYTIVSFVDASHEKRKRIFERIFFHDILNTASNLVGLSNLVADSLPEIQAEDIDLIRLCAKQLVEEIRSQQLIVRAENNKLTIQNHTLQAVDCLKQIVEIYKEFSTTRGINVMIDADTKPVTMQSDKTLLLRVISNMAKNAVEASSYGDAVTLGCYRIHHHILFWVHNRSFIPRSIQLKIFQRSFSTKGGYRGLGTYSIKLLVENYLGGNVAFDSSQSEGTCFFFTIPVTCCFSAS